MEIKSLKITINLSPNNSNKNLIKTQNQSTISLPKTISTTKKYQNIDDLDTLYMGVAEPLTSEDIEREFETSKKIETSTQKDGISTWILLSGAKSPTTQAPKESSSKESQKTYSVRSEAKIEKIVKTDVKKLSTQKPKLKPVTATQKIETVTTPKLNSIKNQMPVFVEKISNDKVRVKKPTSPRPELITKKKKSSTTIKATSSTTTTTEVPEIVKVTEQPNTPVSSTTMESTTFLILEPKDADFDLPQDRSPGITKKPKNKKNKIKTSTEEKKPDKTALEKPLTTKIYNYFAREVMPTVGVGLVGLTVAAGLATYFLAPFAPVRRSYEITDRKDDIYSFNPEEYANSQDGQSEEEVFGKVIAGMPVNSPYRNNIRYSIYRPNPNQIHIQSGPRPMRQHPQMPPPNYRFRNNMQQSNGAYFNHNQHSGPGGYGGQSNVIAQPNPIYNTKRKDIVYPQQFYRYHSEPVTGIYRSNIENEKIDAQQSQTNTEDKQQEDLYGPMIVTPETHYQTVESSIDVDKMPEENILSRRSQFVVGSIPESSSDFQLQQEQQQQQVEIQPSVEINETPMDTVNVIPEHGPRRRREADSENELDFVFMDNTPKNDTSVTLSTTTVVPNDVHKDETTTASNVDVTTEKVFTNSTTNVMPRDDISKNDTIKLSTTTVIQSNIEVDVTTEKDFTNSTTTEQTMSKRKPTKPKFTKRLESIRDLIRQIFVNKLRIGLYFLQGILNATMDFQRHLENYEKPIEQTQLFNHSDEKRN